MGEVFVLADLDFGSPDNPSGGNLLLGDGGMARHRCLLRERSAGTKQKDRGQEKCSHCTPFIHACASTNRAAQLARNQLRQMFSFVRSCGFPLHAASSPTPTSLLRHFTFCASSHFSARGCFAQAARKASAKHSASSLLPGAYA